MSKEGIKTTLFFHISCARDVKQENGAMLPEYTCIRGEVMNLWLLN